LRKHLRSNAGPAPFSLLLLLWDEPHRLFQVSPIWDTLYGGWRYWEDQTVWTVPDRPWSVDIIVGNCVLVPAAAFAECGLFGLYLSDINIGLKLFQHSDYFFVQRYVAVIA
jgi:hypothetical protein